MSYFITSVLTIRKTTTNSQCASFSPREWHPTKKTHLQPSLPDCMQVSGTGGEGLLSLVSCKPLLHTWRTAPMLSMAFWGRRKGQGIQKTLSLINLYHSQKNDLCPQCIQLSVWPQYICMHTHTLTRAHRGHTHTHSVTRQNTIAWVYFFLSSFSSPASFSVHSGIIIIALLAWFCSSLEWSRCRQL